MTAPWLRFALLGAVLFGLSRALAPATAPPAPAAVDLAALDAVERALLAGIDRSATVRARLVALGRELHLADTDDPVALEREARALGLTRSDPVLRRHLSDLLALATAAGPAPAVPDEATLREYHARRAADWTLPARVRFSHVYLSRDRRGARADDDATAVLAALRARAAPADRAAGLGDPFARGAHLGPLDDRGVAALLGPAFAAALAAAPVGEWSGPIASPYGLHLVLVEERQAAAPAAFEAVRGQVAHRWLRERTL